MELRDYADRYNTLAGRFLAHCLREHPGENVFVSPASALVTLALAADSAAGPARQEILKALAAVPGQEDAGEVLADFLGSLSPAGCFASAGAVCAQPEAGKALRKSYREEVLPRYGAELFTGGDMALQVNAWASRQTGGLIRQVLPESPAEACFALVNAVCFDCPWRKPVPDWDVCAWPFRNADGTETPVEMLNATEDTYIERDGYAGFLRPYRDRRFAFMAVLPDGKRRRSAGKQPAAVDFHSLWRSARPVRVHMRMPEFRFDRTEDLASFCAAAGIRTLFTPEADFAPLSPGPLRMQALLQRTFIEVNRAGTRAAAVTAAALPIVIFPGEETKTVTLDRPFLFAIVHSMTGLPLFTGAVNRL